MTLPVGAALIALFDRPSSTATVIAMVAAAAGWFWHVRAERTTRTTGPTERTDDHRPSPLGDGSVETPAVIALLVGDPTPDVAVTATALHLAARGRISFATVDDELVVVTRGAGGDGGPLTPFEQQVLAHLRSLAYDELVSSGTLAVARDRLGRWWWWRFRRSVARTATTSGLCVRRYGIAELAPSMSAVVIGLTVAWRSARGGTEVAIVESWLSRSVWLATIISLCALARHTAIRSISPACRLTELGGERRTAWLAYRSRLAERIPPGASVLAGPTQQATLAEACVMGVATQVFGQLPIVAEDHRVAWSDAGGSVRRVRIRYPSLPGYGLSPLRVGASGLAVVLVSLWARSWFRRVGDGEAFGSLLERLPGRADLVTTLADHLATASSITILLGAVALIVGAVDSVATSERTGVVIRTRRPAEVIAPSVSSALRPFADRNRFSTYLAIDDGRRTTITAWLVDDRDPAPQGAFARVRVTPVLGYVRSCEPVGTSGRL